jgi:hypothetical protein
MIDDQEDETNGNRSLAQDPRHRGINEKASSIYDFRHRLVVGYVWELPFTHRLRGALRGVLDGWQLGGIVTEQSGSPFRISQSADTQNNDSVGAARPDMKLGVPISVANPGPSLWFNTAAFTASVFHYGNTPRNPVVGPGLHTFDLSVGKQFKMPYGERHSLQFRTEFFNALNTPQFANPGSALGTGSFGRVTSTNSNNRQIQFGLRYAF